MKKTQNTLLHVLQTKGNLTLVLITTNIPKGNLTPACWSLALLTSTSVVVSSTNGGVKTQESAEINQICKWVLTSKYTYYNKRPKDP